MMGTLKVGALPSRLKRALIIVAHCEERGERLTTAARLKIS